MGIYSDIRNLVVLLFLGLFSIFALFTVERRMDLNFCRGLTRTEYKILFTIPLGSKTEKNDYIYDYFKGEWNRLPDRWIYMGTKYYDCRLNQRITNGLGFLVLKIMNYHTQNDNLSDDKESSFIHELLIEILNTASAIKQSNLLRDLDDKIRSNEVIAKIRIETI